VRKTGPASGTNPFRFSTKYQDDETDLLYYGHRYYCASTGRWLSRDRIGEAGGVNIYSFTRNNAIAMFDFLGLALGQFRWVEPYEVPKEGPPRGITQWSRFSPQTKILEGGCCYTVQLSGGYAQAQITYSPGTLFGHDVLTHERAHVRLHLKPAYDDYKSAAEALGRQCRSARGARCIKNVIEDELVREYKARSLFEGMTWDWGEYGESQNDEALRLAIEKARVDYSNAQAATRQAIDSCEAL
jgi:RHS repeat-associated protein